MFLHSAFLHVHLPHYPLNSNLLKFCISFRNNPLKKQSLYGSLKPFLWVFIAEKAHGLFFTDNSDLLFQASSILSSHAIQHTYTNPLQAKPPKDFDKISYSFPVTSEMQITPIISLLNSISFVDSFYFAAIVSADNSLSSSSDINFFLRPPGLITFP